MALACAILSHARHGPVRCTTGFIRLNGQRVVRASMNVGAGDVLTLPQGSQVVVVRVLGVAKRRNGAPEARLLYEILPETPLDRESPAP